MKERPILMSSPMDNAILDDRKTKTRRTVKPQPELSYIVDCGDGAFGDEEGDVLFRCPYGVVGDRLWVRETLRMNDSFKWEYSADKAPVWLPEDHPAVLSMISWAHHKEGDTCVSIHMPRWASRITLEITDVLVERLQDITPEDAITEGLKGITKDGKLVKYGIPDRDGYPGNDNTGWPWCEWRASPVDAYCALWESINGPKSWDANPWVWVIEFKRIEAA